MKNKKIKIIFILEHFYPHIGGAETLFFNLIKKLSKIKKIEIIVATSNSGGITGEKKYSKNFKVFYFNWPSFFGHPIPLYKDVKKLIKESDIVHTGTYTSGFFSWFFAKLNKKKIVLTVYENLFFKWFLVDNFFRSLIFFIFEFITVHLPFDYYIGISQSTKNDLIKSGINKNKIKVIYPFIEDELFIKNKNNQESKNKFKNYFLYFGRPGKTKGIFILLKAINLLKEKLPKDFYFLLILSDDPLNEKNKIIDFVKKNKLEDIVKVKSPLPKKKLIKKIKESFCVIIPSITEGFGYSAYESILLGKPVILSDAGSLKEIASGKYLLFKSRDFKDLSEKIMLALKDKFYYKERFLINKDENIKLLIDVYKNTAKISF